MPNDPEALLLWRRLFVHPLEDVDGSLILRHVEGRTTLEEDDKIRLIAETCSELRELIDAIREEGMCFERNDLDHDQWELIQPLLPPPPARGPSGHIDSREILNAIRYLLSNRCDWSSKLPRDFPSKGTIRCYFHHWTQNGLWDRISEISEDNLWDRIPKILPRPQTEAQKRSSAVPKRADPSLKSNRTVLSEEQEVIIRNRPDQDLPRSLPVPRSVPPVIDRHGNLNPKCYTDFDGNRVIPDKHPLNQRRPNPNKANAA